MKLATKLLLAAAGAGLAAWQMERRVHRYSFRNKVVVLVGGSRGVGLAMARLLKAEGAYLALLGRSEETLERAQSELEGAGGAVVESFPCDVTRPSEVESAFERIEETFGRVDVLINNAGTILCAPFDNHEDEDFEHALNTHLMGPLYTTRAALPIMRRHGDGRILNVSSIGGKIGIPHMTAYTASKYALVGFSRALAAELRREGIRVTVACPGLMRTGSHRTARFRGRQEKEFAWFSALNNTPGVSMAAVKAAKKMLEGCRSGRPELVFPWQWWVAAVGGELLPTASVSANDWVNRLLPEKVKGDTAARRGRSAAVEDGPVRLEKAGAMLNQD